MEVPAGGGESMEVDATMNGHGLPASSSRGLTRGEKGAILLGAFAFAVLILQSLVGHGTAHAAGHGAADHVPSLWSVLPFAGLLLSIALLPLIPATTHWWESNKNRLAVALAFGAITLVYYAFAFGVEKIRPVLTHALVDEYIPFIMLLFALYVISGGIRLSGDIAAHPATNTTFLGVGALAASFLGTTGASMLLIRPLLQTNVERKYKVHTVVFFIFLVSNIGGTLLPIGDPPLFLGYLRGVPFLWTFGLWKEWALVCGVLLGVYYVWDSWAYRRETLRDLILDETQKTPLRLTGKINLLWLLGVVLSVALIKPGEPLPLLGFTAFPFMRELAMLVFVALSLKCGDPRIRAANGFNYHAILEVAALFIGIFICMQAPIEILRGSGETLAKVLKSPTHFFWATGALSSFLDNAPTYVVFFETAETLTPAGAEHAVRLLDGGAVDLMMLTAVSLGAVFMGAMTYIGNAPNFMVKSIAEQSGVKMPSFFGYMLYSCGLLLPLFFLVTLIFLH
ncbi:MAG: sodium:proton antiporter [Planctomycetota bacterium]|nr:MAG: sodium:proton antiporter [Planctomycetota bacterium]